MKRALRLLLFPLAGRGVLISMTECYRLTDYHEPIVALKVYVLSPFVDEEDVELRVSKVLEARSHVPAEAPPVERRA